MDLLVTGGLGFIGSNFIREMLAGGHARSIVNLDKQTYAGNPDNLRDIERHPGYAHVRGDICDYPLVSGVMDEHPVDAVVHFAAESHVDRSLSDPGVFVRSNVLGTHVLLDAAMHHGVSRFVHISTDEVYGSAGTGSFRETDPLNPSSPYSASKAAGDLLVRSYFTSYGFPAIITRCSNNFGPYQYPEKLIPLFVTNLLEKKKVPLYGTGKNVRDWIYVKDHCAAIRFLLQHGAPGEIYNIGGGNEVSNLEMTAYILEALGAAESMIEHVADRPGHDFRYSVDSTKLAGLGWKPAYSFEKALASTIDWYCENEWWWYPLKHGQTTR